LNLREAMTEKVLRKVENPVLRTAADHLDLEKRNIIPEVKNLDA